MTLTTHLLAITCILIMSSGQLLFKVAADGLKVSGTFFDTRVMTVAGIALALYGVATVLWILILQDAPLSRAYPYMALSFVLVSVASWALFNELMSAGQIAGVGLIVCGIVLTALS